MHFNRIISIGAAAMIMASASLPAMAAGDDVVTRESSSEFADVSQAVQDGIINRGYTIDYHGFIGDMLKRTAEDVGASKELYKDAEFFTFCSAVVSRDVMEADIGDIAYCPYVVFVYEDASMEGTVTVGFRQLPSGGARDQVNELLTDIIEEAADGF